MLTGTGSRVNFSFCERPGVATRLAVDSVFLAALHVFGSRWTRRCCCWRMACAWAMARPLGGLFCVLSVRLGRMAPTFGFLTIALRHDRLSPLSRVGCHSATRLHVSRQTAVGTARARDRALHRACYHEHIA